MTDLCIRCKAMVNINNERFAVYAICRNGGKQGDASLLAEQQPLVAIEAEERLVY